MHPAREANADGRDIINNRSGENGCDGQASPSGGVEQLRQAPQAASEKEEIGSGFEDALFCDGGSPADGMLECEAVVCAVPDHEGRIVCVVLNPVCFVL